MTNVNRNVDDGLCTAKGDQSFSYEIAIFPHQEWSWNVDVVLSVSAVIHHVNKVEIIVEVVVRDNDSTSPSWNKCDYQYIS